MASPGGTLKPRRRGWASFRLSNGPVFDCQGSGEMSQVGLFSFVNWACFRLPKTALPSEGAIQTRAVLKTPTTNKFSSSLVSRRLVETLWKLSGG
jgi:hypothetical protein